MNDLLYKLRRRKPDLMGKENYFISAVLIPLIRSGDEWEILFEVRSMELDRQPGEICFPGGRVERHELDCPEKAAIREAAEELGLREEDVHLLAPLDVLVTPMGPVVYPYVGEILTPQQIQPSRYEVDHVFNVPVSHFLNHPPQVSSTEVATRYGPDFPLDRVPETYRGNWKKRWVLPMYSFEYGDYFIWGMTATILHHFMQRIKE